MKVINLNESQYKRLFEISSFVQSAGNEEGTNGVPDNLTKDKVWAGAIIKKKDGEGYSNPPGVLGKDPHATDFSPNDRKDRPGRANY